MNISLTKNSQQHYVSQRNEKNQNSNKNISFKGITPVIDYLTTNPVLNALSRAPSVNSKLGNLAGKTNNSKNYYFSNFTVQADDIQQFINSIETIMPINNK